MLEVSQLEISPFQPSQRTDLERIAAVIFEDADAAATEGAAVLVAHWNGAPVGFATRSERRVHPHASSLTIGVLPEFRGRGVGSASWQAMTATMPSDRVWRVGLSEDRNAGKAFLERRGFQVMRQTWFAALEAAPTTSLEPDLIWAQPPSRSVLSSLIRDHYIATHGINPPAELSLETWQELFLDEALPDSVRLLTQGDVPVATAALAPSLDGLPNTLDVAFLSVRPDWHARAQHLVPALLNELLDAARAHGATQVILEVDSTDPVALHALDQSTVRGACWLTLQTGIPDPPARTIVE